MSAHNRDVDCLPFLSLDGSLCTVCGVDFTSDPCPDCGCRGFHLGDGEGWAPCGFQNKQEAQRQIRLYLGARRRTLRALDAIEPTTRRQIGRAYPSADGSIAVFLSSLPLSGSISLQVPEDSDE